MVWVSLPCHSPITCHIDVLVSKSQVSTEYSQLMDMLKGDKLLNVLLLAGHSTRGYAYWITVPAAKLIVPSHR